MEDIIKKITIVSIATISIVSLYALMPEAKPIIKPAEMPVVEETEKPVEPIIKPEPTERNLKFNIKMETDNGDLNFTAHWINRLDQFGFTDLTLVIKNQEGLITEQRISKNYETKFVNKAFLEAEAKNEITKIIYESN